MCKPSKKKSNISQQENQIPESTEMKEPEIVQEQSTEQSVSTEDFITGKVYFCRILENGTQRILTAFRKIPTDNSLEHALKALLSGPTEAEESHDIVTNIPENTTLKSITQISKKTKIGSAYLGFKIAPSFLCFQNVN